MRIKPKPVQDFTEILTEDQQDMLDRHQDMKERRQLGLWRLYPPPKPDARIFGTSVDGAWLVEDDSTTVTEQNSEVESIGRWAGRCHTLCWGCSEIRGFSLSPLSFSLSLCLFFCLSLSLSPLSLCVSLSVSLSLYVYLCLSVCLSLSLSPPLSLSLFLSLSPSLSLPLYPPRSVCLSASPSLSLSLSLSVSVSLSLCLSLCPPPLT